MKKVIKQVQHKVEDSAVKTLVREFGRLTRNKVLVQTKKRVQDQVGAQVMIQTHWQVMAFVFEDLMKDERSK